MYDRKKIRSAQNVTDVSFFCSATLFCNLYFSIYIIKIRKIFILLSLPDLTFASGREGTDNPLSRWLQGSYLFV